MNTTNNQYVLFLRGINVGRHHKVPMASLKLELEKIGFKNIITLLNSGNVIFQSSQTNITELETLISKHLFKVFNFEIPVILKTSKSIKELINNSPFANFELTKEMRFYVSFLKTPIKTDLQLPWISEDKAYTIIENRQGVICSVLNISVSKTTKAIKFLEQHYGKNITTRNWNTLIKISNKLNA